MIQVLGHSYYSAKAQAQYDTNSSLQAKRGEIKTSDGYSLASNQIAYTLFAEPEKIPDKEMAARTLSEEIFNDARDANYSKYLSRLSMKLRWVVLERDLSPEDKERVESLALKGLGFEEEPTRFYPEGSMAAHILGYVAQTDTGEKTGYFGIEGAFEGDLKGKHGKLSEERDAAGMPIITGSFSKIDSLDGRDIYLTIDRCVQYMVEQKLKEGVETYGAVAGSVIVTNPADGSIVAMANYPSFSPNKFNEAPIEVTDYGRKSVEIKNSAISETYEPGSVIKPLTVAAGLDTKKITVDSAYVDSGPVVYSNYTVDNWDGKHHGPMNITLLLQKSNNIGASWVGHQIGAKDLATYFKTFGLGSRLGIDLEGEDTGVVRDFKDWTDIDLATASFGQGISATPLQVLFAFNAMANGGILYQPRIVSKIQGKDEVIELKSRQIHRVMKSQTAEIMVDLLTKAVDGGESKYFNIKNYKIAGKTGTAQIPIPGGYDSKKTNATFVGFPTISRKFSMIVKLREPHSSPYAAETAVPLWMDIAEELAKYYGLEPDQKTPLPQ